MKLEESDKIIEPIINVFDEPEVTEYIEQKKCGLPVVIKGYQSVTGGYWLPMVIMGLGLPVVIDGYQWVTNGYCG